MPRFLAALFVVLAAQAPAQPLGAAGAQRRPAVPAQSAAAASLHAAPPPPTIVEPNKPRSEPPSAPKQQLVYQVILTGYQPNYFITGFSSASAVKFQLSFKLDLWPNYSQHSLYFGYTQKSLWDLYGNPGGFRDSNYAPELFYGYFKRLRDILLQAGELEIFVNAARIGILHESNGRTEEDVRSWNRVYGFIAGGAYLGTDHYLGSSLEAWIPFQVSPNNRDITDFLGYGRLGASYVLEPAANGFLGAIEVSGAYSHGWTLDAHYGLELSLRWRPGYGRRVRWWRFTPSFFAQVYSGYGEYLLAYDESRTSFRIGISIEDRVYWIDGAP